MRKSNTHAQNSFTFKIFLVNWKLDCVIATEISTHKVVVEEKSTPPINHENYEWKFAFFSYHLECLLSIPLILSA